MMVGMIGRMTGGLLLLAWLLGCGLVLGSATSHFTDNSTTADVFQTPLPTPFIQNLRASETELGEPLILSAAKTLGLYLHGITLKELAIHKMEEVLGDSTFTHKSKDDAQTAKTVSLKISRKLEKYKSIVEKSKSAIEAMFNVSTSPFPAISGHGQCCDFSPMQLKYSPNFGLSINRDLICDTLSSRDKTSGSSSFLRSNLTSVFSSNLGSAPGIRWQYLLSKHGQELVYPGWGNPGRPCTPSQVNHDQILVESLYKHSKELVIVIEHGKGMSGSSFNLAKTTAKFIINLLSNSDRAAVIALDDSPTVVTPYPSESSLLGRLVNTCHQTNLKFDQLIDRLQVSDGSPDHKSGLLAATKVLDNSGAARDTAQIIYITSGDKENIQTIVSASDEAVKRHQLILVPVYAAEKSHPTSLAFDQIKVVPVHSEQSIAANKVDFFTGKKRPESTNCQIHAPRRDNVGIGSGGDLVIPLSMVLSAGAGVVGLDVQVAALLEDLVHTEFSATSRIFLVDETGLSLAHPALPAPEKWNLSIPPHISMLETSEGFAGALQRMTSQPSGLFVTDDGVSYTWEQVEGSSYVVVVATEPFADGRPRQTDDRKRMSGVPMVGDMSDIQHHALIPEGKSKLCRHMRQIASMQTASLYLAPTAFAAPFEHRLDMAAATGSLASSSASRTTTAFMAYLTDSTRLIANPGLKDGVKDDVSLLAHIVGPWKELAFSSPLNNYIVRRRIYTPRGVQLSYPGASVEEGTDPAKQFWFEKAVRLSNLVVVSPPRLDPGGAGYIVTVSKALQTSNATDDNFLAGVVAADYTLGYFYKILNDTVPRQFCAQPTARCFLIDDRGNMIAHPDLTRQVMKYVSFPSESQHLTHMEFSIATDMLMRMDYIVKKVCRDLTNEKLQRYFQLDSSSPEVIGNSGSLDQCTQYKLTAVPGTNLFIGLVNQSCPSSAFCWCSTLDRTCLDCQSWEQGQCECPCECDIKDDYCGEEPAEEAVPVCEAAPAHYQPQRYSTSRHDLYPPCIHTDCSSRSTEQDCFGVLGCSWCTVDLDGEAALKSPVCLEQAECFGGVLHSASPYSRIYDQSLVLLDSEDDRSLSRAGPIGPVAGGILAFFLLLGLAVWSYKHWTSGERGLLSGLQGSSLTEEEPDDGAIGGGQLNYGLHQSGDPGQGITVVSPYRMNPSYRRPRPAGTDSDHGYSTMTPGGDQDSEIMSCLGDQAAQNRRIRNKNPLSLQSVTSGTSSRTSSPLQGPLEMAALSGDEKQLATTDSNGVANSSERDNLMMADTAAAAMPQQSAETNRLFPGRNQVPPPTTIAPLGTTTVLNKNQFIVAATVHMVDA